MKNVKVLVVEDNDGLREMLVEALPLLKRRCEVVGTTIDGKWAKLFLDDPFGHDVHLVITDFQMPRMNGLELAGYIKRVWGSRVKVILTSSWHNPDALKEIALVAGADAFIKKPFQMQELQMTIASLFPD